MKHIHLLLVTFLIFTACSNHQSKEPWSPDQLMAPNTLAQKIENDQMDDIQLIHIGFEDLIPGSENAGPASEEEGLENLKSILANTPKEKTVVIYCGCCPFDECPNIRPAFKVLKEMGFENSKLLELSTSIKADWLDKNYPVKEK